MSITAEQLRERVLYDPETGTFISRLTGRVVGSTTAAGYVVIAIARKRQYTAHRLAWLYVRGEWPSSGVDHINRDKADNRIANLRLADKAQNGANSIHKSASSGYRGVYYQSNTRKWRAKLGRRSIGYFWTKEEAHEAYCREHQRVYGEFSAFHKEAA